MLGAKNLSHSFDYDLFDNINIELNQKKSTAILGVSGSGKSTLLHILSSFLKPKSGEVFFEGKNIYSLNSKELVELRKNEFGIIFQSHYLFRGFSARENLEVASIMSGEPIDESLADKFGVAHVLSQPISTLSGGQQQRISIVRVLTKKPRVIFADEPTGNLDKDSAKQVMSTIFEYINTNCASLLCVTHDENLAHSCDFVYRLEKNALITVK
ncbi:MAG: ABC transporter ATP-binding protein [Campylobacteraceae bacterium]|jgi:putative ABC transport system ATP-binding protein|nr:ABC transporter ATP-binding protein [Campylobacteraceae bacterium]